MDINEKIAQVERELAVTQEMMARLNEQIKQTIASLNERMRQLSEKLIRLDERRKVYLEEKQEAEKAAKEV